MSWEVERIRRNISEAWTGDQERIDAWNKRQVFTVENGVNEAKTAREFDEKRLGPMNRQMRINKIFQDWVDGELWWALDVLREKILREVENG